MPRPAPPGVGDDEFEIVMDGVGYALHMPAAFGRNSRSLNLTSNVGTPLAAWVDGAMTRMASCWSAVELRVR